MSSDVVSEYSRLAFPSIPENELEIVLWEIEAKQYCLVAVLETTTGQQYPISFITPLRAKQNRESYPFNCCVGPCLIVVEDTRLTTMESSARAAWEKGLFEYVSPLEDSRG